MLGFRVWIPLDNQFSKSIKDYRIGNYGELFYFGFPVDTTKFILSQSTGLKDMKGSEIYEGDILWIEMHHQEYPIVVGSALEFLIDLHLYEDDGLLCPMRIIGNIYSNPELLERTKC